jgi:HEAT repeat protein
MDADALAAARAQVHAASAEPDEDRRWAALQQVTLSPRLGRALVLELIGSPDGDERWAGASLINMMAGSGDPELGAVAAKVLPAALEAIDEPEPLSDLLTAIGHLHAPALHGLVLRYAKHDDPEVREAVAFALGGLEAPVDAEILTALYGLASDPDDGVRGWALFALGDGRVDGPTDTPEAIALFRGAATDEDPEIAREGRAALAALGLDVAPPGSDDRR